MRLMKDNVERIAESEAQISKLKAAGYRPLEKSEGSREAPEPDPSKMKIDELRSLAKERGIEGAASLNKEELLAVLKE